MISNSKKTLALIRAKHTALQDKNVSLDVFAGYLSALNDLKLIEVDVRKMMGENAPAAPIEAVPV